MEKLWQGRTSRSASIVVRPSDDITRRMNSASLTPSRGENKKKWQSFLTWDDLNNALLCLFGWGGSFKVSTIRRLYASLMWHSRVPMHYEYCGYADAMETEAGVAASSRVHLQLEQHPFQKALPGTPTFPSHLTFRLDCRSPACDTNNTWGSSQRSVMRWHIWTFAASLIKSTSINLDLCSAKSQPKASHRAFCAIRGKQMTEPRKKVPVGRNPD